MKRFPICDILRVGRVIDNIQSQGLVYPVDLMYRLYKVKKKSEDIAQYVLKQLALVLGDGWDVDSLNKDEITVYNLVMSSVIEEDIPNIEIDDLMHNDRLQLTLEEVGILSEFFKID